MLNALTIPGITYTQKLLVSPSPLYKRNVGIIPPFTYMVMTQNRETSLWNRNLLRLTIKARIALAARDNRVPISVLATVI